MDANDEELDRIHRYVLDNIAYFCDPHPEGLGWERPGGIPKFYRDNPAQWELDLKRVEDLKRAARLREAAAGREEPTASQGMAPHTKEILDSIRRMHQEGISAAEIAHVLRVRERAIRSVLAMGVSAYDNSPSGAVTDPLVREFTQRWGRIVPEGGDRNGNRNGNGHKDGQF